MMRRTLNALVCLGLAMACGLVPGSAVTAQDSAARRFFVPGASLFETSTADGVVMFRGTSAPLKDENGGNAGLATVTGFAAHPTMAFLPTFVTADLNGVGRVEITSFERNPIFIPRFGATRRGYAFFETLAGDIDAAVIRAGFGVPSPGERYFGFKLGLRPTFQLPPTTLNLAVDFTQERVDRAFGDTGTAYRNDSRLNLVAAFGRKDPIGTNFSFSFANTAHAYNFNFLDTPVGDALVTCRASPFRCWWRGTEAYFALRGSAASVNLGSLGVSGGAGTALTIQSQVASPAAGHGPCPEASPPPPPAGLFGVRGTSRITLAWDSVECAKEYVLQLSLDGQILGEQRIAGTTLEGTFSIPDAAYSFRVATVDQRGVVGPFSGPEIVVRVLP
jgi:hypothetical protein